MQFPAIILCASLFMVVFSFDYLLAQVIPVKESCNCERQSKILHDNKRFASDENTPKILLRANFIFLQNDEGKGGFEEDNPLHQKYWNEIIGTSSTHGASLNYRYANFEDKQDEGNCYDGFIRDGKVEFAANRLFIKDSYGWNNENDSCPDGCPGYYGCKWYLDYLHDKIVADSSIPKGINVFFTERASAYYKIAEANKYLDLFGGRSCSMMPDCDVTHDLKCNMKNTFLGFYSKSLIPSSPDTYKGWDSLLYWDPYPKQGADYYKNTYNWAFITASLVSHELGHSLGLGHGYNHCPNNIMNNEGGSRNYLKLDQLGQIHKNLCTTVLRNYVEGCPYNPINIFEITGDDLIDFDFTWYGDIVVRTGGTLTIACTVRMPDNARIIVERGARLIVDSGKVTSACGGRWQGIEVAGNSERDKGKRLKQEHPQELNLIYDFNSDSKGSYPSDANHHGVVILNNAVIENAARGVTTGRSGAVFSKKYSGGIVLAENSVFRNNILAIRMLQFNDRNGDQPAAYHFKNCTFETDDEEGSEDSCSFIQNCGISGGQFAGNTFTNQRKLSQSEK